jgi:Holliday junction resolvasome RuvABC DNA-binding subunit
MADRLPDGSDGGLAMAVNGAGPEGEAQGALLALGYKPAEISRMLKNLDVARLTTEELIKEALRQAHAG